MIQAYSSNIAVAANSVCPYNNVVIDKGCSDALVGAGTIQFNRCGVYLVECDGFCEPSAAGTVSFQLYKNGQAQPQAISSFTGTTGSIGTFGFKTFVQCPNNNTKCCCTSPTTVQVMTGDTAVEGLYINVCVAKIC